jgi:hypothetical protein
MVAIHGREDIENFRVLTLRAALRLEIAGMNVSKGRTAYQIIKSEFGFKGSKVKVLEQLDTYIRDNNISGLTNPEGGDQ